MPAAVGVENAEIARIFREYADLLELEGANPFRVRAYRNAARTLEEASEPIHELVVENPLRLTELPGIGADLAGKICDIVETGTFQGFDKERRALPAGLPGLLRVRGLGPKRARALHDSLGIASVKGLERAARAGRVRTVPGFGAATERRLLEELDARLATGLEHRTLRAVAAQYGEALLGYLLDIPGVQRAEIAGSFRRCRETVGDLDVLVEATPNAEVSDRFVTYPEASRVLAHGPTRASIRLRSGLQVDLRVLPGESYGAGLYYFTGSKAHNIAVRMLGRRHGLKINEYGVFRGKRRVGGRTELEVFEAVGLPWIPPELRENRGEIEAAQEGRLPHLLELRDMRGDLQMHTPDSDGRDELATLAEAAEALGYEYIAVTDHSPALRMVRGLDRAGFRRQMKRIDRLNSRLRTLTVLKGAEVDILPDGSLDLDDETLAELDLVVASIHSKFDLAERAQTDRILRAVSHPSVDILGHPTGRLLGRRPGMRLDLERVMHTARDHGVMLEVNAQPDRLDLDELACRAAIELGLKVVISTDAHAAAELGFMRWGVDQARRGWAARQDVANTLPLPRLLKLLHAGRR
jgi:DNA polymerase (family 10)